MYFEWQSWGDERLLDLRICDLGLDRPGPFLEAVAARLYRELARAGLRFRPHLWLSDDWFTPEGVPGMAVPFCLAHPRLVQLELDCVGEVEGGTESDCLKILRHEAGHALDHAFGLRRRKERQRRFGLSSEPYPDWYVPRPFSRRYVRNLPEGYAQSHPDEDFAETFAVWLDPTSAWRRRYAGWPALEKLLYMDRLMKELRDQPPTTRRRRVVQPAHRLRRTLREHYRERQLRFLRPSERGYDGALLRVFGRRPRPGTREPMTAEVFLRTIKKETCRKVALHTGAYGYQLQRIFDDLIERSRALNLRLSLPAETTRVAIARMLTARAPETLRSTRHFVSL